MKPFDLKAAQAGAPILIGGKEPARFVGVMRSGTIVVELGDYLHRYKPSELCMAPAKHTGFINLYRSTSGLGSGLVVHDTLATAEHASACNPQFVAVAQVEWEE